MTDNPKPTAGQLIKALVAVDERVDGLNGQLRQAHMEREGIVEQLEGLMDEQGTTMLAAEGLVCEAKYDTVPQVTDWQALERFVLRHKKLELFQRRLSPAVWRDLLEQREGTAVPGVIPFQKRKLSVRKR